MPGTLCSPRVCSENSWTPLPLHRHPHLCTDPLTSARTPSPLHRPPHLRTEPLTSAPPHLCMDPLTSAWTSSPLQLRVLEPWLLLPAGELLVV